MRIKIFFLLDSRMKLAISGSRNYKNYEEFKQLVDDFFKKNLNSDDKLEYIISGGAIGTDSLAEMYASEYGIQMIIIKPDYNKYSGKIAPLIRNKQIINLATHLCAFPSNTGSGTQHTISFAQEKSIIISIHYID